MSRAPFHRLPVEDLIARDRRALRLYTEGELDVGMIEQRFGLRAGGMAMIARRYGWPTRPRDRRLIPEWSAVCWRRMAELTP